MKIKYAALSAVVSAGVLLAAAAPASPYVVCNRYRSCWHTTERYDYRPKFGVTVHDDAWKWRGRHYRWREHEGRGYWNRSGVWVTF